jgi:hypothetical protein
VRRNRRVEAPRGLRVTDAEPQVVDAAVGRAEADVQAVRHRMLAIRRTHGPVLPLDQPGVCMGRFDAQHEQHGAIEALGRIEIGHELVTEPRSSDRAHGSETPHKLL